jgi:hypothetical protein
MEILKNLWADLAGGEKIGFLDASQQSLYSTPSQLAIFREPNRLTTNQSLLPPSLSIRFSGSIDAYPV